MFLPSKYGMLEPVAIAAIVVFIFALIGNILTFRSRFVSALVTGILFAVVFGALTYYHYGSVSISVGMPSGTSAPVSR